MTRAAVRKLQDGDLSVARVPRHAARLFPSKPALEDGVRSLTYAELEAQVEHLACALAELGVDRGAVVCAYLPNCIDYVLVVLAVARAGGVFSPVNPRFKAYEIAALLQCSRPRVLFTTAQRCEAVVEGVRRAGCEAPRLVIVDTPSAAPAGALRLPDLLSCQLRPLPDVAESDFFSLMFTSGTTGEPKGALATHRARMLWVLNAAIQYGLNEDDNYLGMMPQVHSAGLTFTLMHLYVGARVRILEHFDPGAVVRIVQDEGVTSTLTVPTMLTMILETLEQAPRAYTLSSLKRVVSCGSPLPLATKKRVIEKLSDRLYDYYGSTESNSMSVLKPRDQLRKPASVGQPFTNVEIMIAGPDGKALAPGEIGEVWCANPSVMSCYLDKPEETAAAFSGRWFRTGDLGYVDEENFLFLVGRSKDVIISGGINIYPAEIEQVMMLHPAVLDCAIVGVADPKWGQSLKAFVVLREGHSLDLAQAQRHCTGYLAEYKKPRYLVIVDEIPKNAGGKTIKAALLDQVKLTA